MSNLASEKPDLNSFPKYWHIIGNVQMTAHQNVSRTVRDHIMIKIIWNLKPFSCCLLSFTKSIHSFSHSLPPFLLSASIKLTKRQLSIMHNSMWMALEWQPCSLSFCKLLRVRGIVKLIFYMAPESWNSFFHSGKIELEE